MHTSQSELESQLTSKSSSTLESQLFYFIEPDYYCMKAGRKQADPVEFEMAWSIEVFLVVST